MNARDRFAAERAAEDAALRELAAIYEEVDAGFAGWTCDASTTCCRFGLTGREPYVTDVEVLALERAIARTGRKAEKVAPRRARRLPVAEERGERRCPLLGPDARCTVYEARPFGCRTYFCERAVPGEVVRQRDVNAFVQRIRAISERLAAAHGQGVGQGDGQGRPLTRALRSPPR